MIEVIGDLWEFHSKNNWVVITTNGNVNSQGKAVMGRGIALQAAKKFPRLPKELGHYIQVLGNQTYSFPKLKLITFPTKNNWWSKSDLFLIEKSACRLAIIQRTLDTTIYLPRPGCENGKLNWEDVKPVLQEYLDNNFVVVQKVV